MSTLNNDILCINISKIISRALSFRVLEKTEKLISRLGKSNCNLIQLMIYPKWWVIINYFSIVIAPCLDGTEKCNLLCTQEE